MPWKINYNPDTKVEGVGTVTAIKDDVVYFRRVDTNDSKDIDEFCIEAKETYDKRDQDKPFNSVLEVAIEAEINK